MFTVTASELIQRSPSMVFALSGDYANDPLWRRGVAEMVYETEGAPRAGSRTRETMRSLVGTTVTVAEVVTFGPSRTAFRSLSGPVPCEGSRAWVAEGGGTRFTYSLTLRPEGAWRWLEPLLRWMLGRQVRDDVRRLRVRLENGGG
jgi:hypothetical protein